MFIYNRLLPFVCQVVVAITLHQLTDETPPISHDIKCFYSKTICTNIQNLSDDALQTL